MKALKLQFSSVSTEASGYESMFSIPTLTINLLNVGSSRGLVKISASCAELDCYRKEKILKALKVWILRKIHFDQYDADLHS
ncbi:hypothetical protein Tco_1362923 [Tanacetum coccineum]